MNQLKNIIMMNQINFFNNNFEFRGDYFKPELIILY